MFCNVDYRGAPVGQGGALQGFLSVQSGGLEGRPQMFKVVDYRVGSGVQHCGLEGRPRVFSVVDYRGGLRFSAW